METENADSVQVPKDDLTNIAKQEATSNHALGLQDLYKAAFSQEAATNIDDFHDKCIVISTNLLEETNEKYFTEGEKLKEGLESPEVAFKNTNFDETYQLHTLKGLQYSVDFDKPEVNSLDLNQLNYETPKTDKLDGVEGLPTSTELNRFYESFHENEANSVLDLDKGIQIHLVKDDGTAVPPTTTDSQLLTYSYETCEYTGDAQILHRYLSDSAFMKDSNSGSNQPIGTVTVNFVNKESDNAPDKSVYDSNSVGVNPETLGVRFEDCDFNSSDSFASIESIIPKNIKCPKCPKKFMFKSDLLKHDKYKHSVKRKLICKYCNREFATQQNLVFHEKSHERKKGSFKCDTCDKLFKKSSVLVNHMMKKHSRTFPFTCSNCEKIFVTRVFLNNHVRKSHRIEIEKPYKCDICSKCFEEKHGLSLHAKSHIEDQFYVCQYCNKAFTKQSYLKNHQKCHETEEKESSESDQCGTDFNSSNALEEHNKKQSGEKRFSCNICLKSFTYKSNCTNCWLLRLVENFFESPDVSPAADMADETSGLSEKFSSGRKSQQFVNGDHVKRHFEVKSYSCNYCEKSFFTSSHLTRHVRTHFKKSSYSCSNCNREFSQRRHLTAHRKKQECNGNKSQPVCVLTGEFVDPNLQNMTLQNVNVIVNPPFGNHQPIVLTSLGSLINSNSVPVILTQNPSEPCSMSSIT